MFGGVASRRRSIAHRPPRSSFFTTGRVRALRATSLNPALTKVEKAPV